jgi:hypothetical protein
MTNIIAISDFRFARKQAADRADAERRRDDLTSSLEIIQRLRRGRSSLLDMQALEALLEDPSPRGAA